MSVMVLKVLLKAWSPPTGPGAGEEEDQEDGHTRRTSASCHMCQMCFGKMRSFNLKTHSDLNLVSH